ncbi:MAG: hypothetical protein AAGA06_13935 [Pseudomonadota bacterium]
MTETVVPADQTSKPALTGPRLILRAVFYALLSPMYLAAPRFTRHFVSTMRTAGVRGIELPKQIASHRVLSPEADEQRAKLFEDLRALVAQDDWIGLAGKLEELDRSRAQLAQSEQRLADLALDFLRHDLAEAVGMPTMCNYDYYFEIPDSVLARVEDAARAHPDNPWLTALLAQVHIDRGWCARGGGWSHEVTEEGWHGLMNSFETAHALLQRFDVEDLRSSMYARVQFQLLATADADDGLRHARGAYHDWSDLDVCNPQPHRSFAFFALPRWFGSWPEFEDEAQAAVARTEHIMGKGAYAHFYLEAFEYDEHCALTMLDVPLFIEALDDLIRRDSDPVCQALRAAVLIGEMTEPEPVTILSEFFQRDNNTKRDALRAMVRRIFETYVTHLPTEQDSEYEGRVLDQMTAAFAQDLMAGQTLEITPDGVRAVPQQAST